MFARFSVCQLERVRWPWRYSVRKEGYRRDPGLMRFMHRKAPSFSLALFISLCVSLLFPLSLFALEGLDLLSGPDGGSLSDGGAPNPEREAMDMRLASSYLLQAREYLMQGDRDQALVLLEAGMDWADTLSDIPFFLAVARYEDKSPLIPVLELLDWSIRSNHFYYSSRETAREMRAMILLTLGRSNEALIELEDLTDTESIHLLRLKALSNTVAPTALLPFLVEALSEWPESIPIARFALDHCAALPVNGAVRAVIDPIIARTEALAEQDSGFLWRIALFTRNFAERRRLAARAIAGGNRESGAILGALDTGAIDAKTAADYLFTRSDTRIDHKDLAGLWSLSRRNQDRNYIRSLMAHYQGTLCFYGPDRPSLPVCVSYKDGQPVLLEYDRDGDRRLDLVVHFTLGRPSEIFWLPSGAGAQATAQDRESKEGVHLIWDAYPYLSEARHKGVIYRFTKQAVSWAPLVYTKDEWASDLWACPTLDFLISEPSVRFLVANARSIERSGTSIPGSTEFIELVSGRPQSAREILDGRQLARKYFRDGLLYREDLDMNKDGYMETRRFYSSTREGSGVVDPVYGPMPMLEAVELDLSARGVWERIEEY